MCARHKEGKSIVDSDGKVIITEKRATRSTRGLGAVALLYKKELHDRVYVVHKNVDASYMWI